MGGLTLGEPFGLDPTIIDSFDWHLAVRRISSDMRSDFIFAPHLRVIFDHNPDGIVKRLKDKLRSGSFAPGSPQTIEVPKPSRIGVRVNPPRRGPNYSRPGSILLPEDRLFYQFLADNCVTLIDTNTDKTRSFSHQIDHENPEKFFKQTRSCWSAFQTSMKHFSKKKNIKYVLKLDVANFFGGINQHLLVNMLSDFGLAKTYADRLEIVLTSFTNSRSSRGIIQGIYPSDLLGNFYLTTFDRFMADQGYYSARYVDDIYIFIDRVSAADTLMKQLIPLLRTIDLTLNEAKSAIYPKTQLVVEEPDLDGLFQNAIEEVREQIDDKDFEISYGFQSEWDDEEEEDDDIQLQATMRLFDEINNFRGHEEEIERFCLPLFLKAGSNYAVDQVIAAFKDRPSMCQIYCSYLAKFVDQSKVIDFLVRQIEDSPIYDWQLMWVVGALMQKKKHDDKIVRKVYKVFKDGNRHDALRAVAAIFIGSKGDTVRINSLMADCANVSPYVQTAIYYVSRLWSGAAKANMRSQWGSRIELSSLIDQAVKNAYKAD